VTAKNAPMTSHRAVRLEPDPDEAAGERADRFARDDDRPARRAAVRVHRDVRAEHEERRIRDQEVERDPGGQQPDPSVLGEGTPALAELADEVGRVRSSQARERHPREQAAKAKPTSDAAPVRSRTANATAIGARFVPKNEVARAAKRRRKFRSRSPSPPLIFIGP
jgi:hypothetical protein